MTSPQHIVGTEAQLPPSKCVLVMKGGGAKGLAYVGALQVLQQYYEFTWFVGTSAGAIAAVLLAAGYSADELESILAEKSFSEFMDAKWYSWPTNLIFKKGLFPGLELNYWLENLLNRKVPGNATAVRLEQLHHRCTVYAARRGTEVLEFDSGTPATKEKEAVLAVRASVAIPYVFQPQFDSEQRVYDGGLRHNYPLLTFLNKHNKDGQLKFLGLYLSPTVYKHRRRTPFIVSDLLGYWLSGSDEQALKDYAKETVVIDPAPVSTLKFNLTDTEKKFLIAAGRAAALDYVSRQSNIPRAPSTGEIKLARDLTETMRAQVRQAVRRRRSRTAVILLGLAFIVLVAAAWGFDYLPHASARPPIKTIAVVPFVGDPQTTEARTNGIADGLRRRLSTITGVVGSQPAGYFKGLTSKEIGARLNVQAVLQVKVTELNKEITVNVELVDSATDIIIHATNEKVTESELPLLEANIARDVSYWLKTDLSKEDQQKVTKTYTTSPEAYNLYTEGRDFYRLRSKRSEPSELSNLDKAIEKFWEALNKDPNYALPLVGLADCYAQLEDHNGESAKATFPKAQLSVELALLKENSLAEAYASLGYIDLNLWEWDHARQAFEKALDLKPNYAQAHHWYAMLLRTMGDQEGAEKQLKLARDNDPSYDRIFSQFGMLYYLKGETALALSNFEEADKLVPNNLTAKSWMGLINLKANKREDALRNAIAGIGKKPEDEEHLTLAFLGFVQAELRDADNAKKQIEKLKLRYIKEKGAAVSIAMVYAGLDQKSEAFCWLERAYAEHSGLLAIFIVMPQFESLRSDPRFADLLNRMRWPDWAKRPEGTVQINGVLPAMDCHF
jgi:predicted acylesterase/phospholipase RssA/tetratricopeptide (TPR) repeat protein